MKITLRVLQPAYFDGKKRLPGELIEVERGDLPGGEVPRWAVVDAPRFSPSARSFRERHGPAGVRAPAGEEFEALEFE